MFVEIYLMLPELTVHVVNVYYRPCDETKAHGGRYAETTQRDDEAI